MEKITLGKIASLVGVSTNALRLYEKKGLIRVQRNPENNYRECSLFDIGAMINIRNLRQAGFSVMEISDLLNQKNVDGIQDVYNHHLSDIEREIKKLEVQRSVIESWKRMLSDTDYTIEEMPAGCFHKYLDIQAGLVSDRQQMEVIQNALSMMPETFPVIYIQQEQIQENIQGSFQASVGIFIPDTAENNSSSAEKSAIHSPCISFTIIRDNDLPAYLQGALDYLHEHEYELSGDMIGRIIGTLTINDRLFDSIVRYSIPFREKIKKQP